MARNDTVTCPAEQWTQLTANDATSVSFQNGSGSGIQLQATAGAVAPTNLNGTFRCIPGGTEFGLALADMFPGVTNPVRLWAYPADGNGSEVWISHD